MTYGWVWIDAEKKAAARRRLYGVQRPLLWLSSSDDDLTPAERHEVSRIEILNKCCIWPPGRPKSESELAAEDYRKRHG